MLLHPARIIASLISLKMNTCNKGIQESCFAVVSACILAFLIAGCEIDSEDSTNSVTINPTAATLKANETNIVEFSASGGDKTYAWSMNNDALGALYVATTNTAYALYQNTTNTGTNLITVRDTSGDSANARVLQQ